MGKTVVAVTEIKEYDPGKVRTAVQGMLEHLGGIRSFVKPGARVLLKPNLLSPRDPAEMVTTHPAVVTAVAELAAEAGGTVLIGDSPGDLTRGLETVWERTGMAEVARRTGAELVSFETAGVRNMEEDGISCHISEAVLQADLVINLPKLKTHVLTLFTGGIKNMYGAVPGYRKKEYHNEYPYPDEFARVITAVYACVRPALTIMDGIGGIEGDGPSVRGHARTFGYMFASTDAVALDAVACSVIGYPPERVAPCRLAAGRGLGTGTLADIDVTGGAIDTLRIPDVKKVSGYYQNLQLVPRFLITLLKKFLWFKPVIDGTKCTLCRTCEKNCPNQALSIKDKKMTYDYTRCINCMCCLESCPEAAIGIRRSWLGRKIHRS